MKISINTIGVTIKKTLSKRKLTNLIWQTVSKRNREKSIGVATVVTKSATESVLIGTRFDWAGEMFVVSRIGYIDFPRELGIGRDMKNSSVRAVTCIS